MSIKSPVRVPATLSGDIYSQDLNNYLEVTNEKSYFQLIEALLEAEIVSYDLETQSDSEGRRGNMEDWHDHSRVVSASYTIPDEGTWVVPLSHPEGPWTKNWKKLFRNFARAIATKNRTKIIAHNLKYELRWTYSITGICLINNAWWDTMMSAYILDENLPANLKDVAVRELGVERWDDVNLKDAESTPWHNLALYNARDTDYTYRVQQVHKTKLLNEEPRLARLFKFQAMPIIKALTRIEREGLPVDLKKVSDRKWESQDIVKTLTDRLRVLAEFEGMNFEDYPTVSFGTTNKFFKDFMEKSGLPVVGYTPKGAPSWDANNLEILVSQGFEIAKDIAEVRKHSSNLSKFYIPWENKQLNGKLFPTFNPMRVDDKWDSSKGTKTGRFSSSNPNAQQIARDKKDCFGGVPGWLFVELDQSQIELRLAAWVAGVDKVINVYREGGDLHSLMASRILDKPVDEVSGGERQKGKAGNFGFLYDMTAPTYVTYARDNYKVDVTLDEAKETRKTFFDDQWPGLSRWHNRQRAYVAKFGYVRNALGRKRRLPDIYSANDYDRGRAERQAINFPIQSLAAELIALAIIEIVGSMDPAKVKLIGTVHDSILALVREDVWEDAVATMAEIMLITDHRRKWGLNLTVPLAVEATVGYHWSAPDAEVREYTTLGG